jgi:hypothetical protein
MSSIEKKISFLNRYFVYKKVRVVNTEAIELELGEYNETAALRDKKDTEHAIEVAEEMEATNKPKIRKLSKKLLLVAATEAIDVQPIVVKSSKSASKKDKKEKKEPEEKKSKKIIIIDSDEED